MKRYKSFLAKQIENYLHYRQALGFGPHPTTSLLKTFDRYLAMLKPEPTVLPPSFFLKLRADLELESRSINSLLSAVRGLFRYLVRQGLYETNPVKDIPRLPKNEIIPFLFTDEQVDLLLNTILQGIRHQQRYFFKDLTYYTVILLIAHCGLRISEPLKMKLQHYRSREKTVYIEKTKFKKDRLIPVPLKVAVEFENYLAVRRSILKNQDNPFIFASGKQKAISGNSVRWRFHKALKQINLGRLSVPLTSARPQFIACATLSQSTR